MSEDIEKTNNSEATEVVKTKKQIYDEEQAKKKAARAKKEAKEIRKAEKAALKKKYQNPAYSVGGKILVWILVISMVAAVVISFVWLIVKAVK